MASSSTRRWVLRAALALALAAHLAPAAAAQSAARYAAGDCFAARVVGVEDGDSMTLLVAGREAVRARLADIDAPEWNQPHGDRSKRMLSDLAFGRDAEVAVLDVDSYERPVVRVSVGRESVNAAMVRIGGAWVFTRYNRDPSLPAVEAEARAARRGLWSLPEGERVPPWEWRAAKREERGRRRAAEAGRQHGEVVEDPGVRRFAPASALVAAANALFRLGRCQRRHGDARTGPARPRLEFDARITLHWHLRDAGLGGDRGDEAVAIVRYAVLSIPGAGWISVEYVGPWEDWAWMRRSEWVTVYRR